MVMRKRLTRIGNSYGVILPRHVLEAAGISPKDQITINTEAGEIRISAPARTEQAIIKAYLKVEKKYDRLFRRLAR